MSDKETQIEKCDEMFPFVFPAIPTDEPNEKKHYFGPPRSHTKSQQCHRFKNFPVPIDDDEFSELSLTELCARVLELECNYAIFGCTRHKPATTSAVKHRFRQFALKLHPDKLLENATQITNETWIKVKTAFESIV